MFFPNNPLNKQIIACNLHITFSNTNSGWRPRHRVCYKGIRGINLAVTIIIDTHPVFRLPRRWLGTHLANLITVYNASY